MSRLVAPGERSGPGARKRALVVASLVGACGSAACGLLIDTEGLVGGAPAVDAGIEGSGDTIDDDVGETGGGDVLAPPDALPDAIEEPDVVGPPPPPSCNATGFACAALAPTGWTGPFALYAGATGNAPSCGAVTQELAANDSLVEPAPAQCGSCSCGVATGAGCGAFAATGQNSFCNSPGTVEMLQPNQCYNRSGLSYTDGTGSQSSAVQFGRSSMTGGACAPAATKPATTVPPLSWGIAAVGCNVRVPATPGCDPSKEVCIKSPEPPFGSKLCISQDGDLPACPGAPYSDRHVYFRGAADTRGCGDCTCGAPFAANCSGNAVLAATMGCNVDVVTAPAPTCLTREPTGRPYLRLNAAPPTDAGCPPDGGKPAGAATPGSPVTVCCQP